MNPFLSPTTFDFAPPDPKQDRINYLEAENTKLQQALEKALEGNITLNVLPAAPQPPKDHIQLITREDKVTRIRDLRLRQVKT